MWMLNNKFVVQESALVSHQKLSSSIASRVATLESVVATVIAAMPTVCAQAVAEVHKL